MRLIIIALNFLSLILILPVVRKEAAEIWWLVHNRERKISMNAPEEIIKKSMLD